MKTINTTLPVYDKLAKQCYERSQHTGNGIVPIVTPRFRLPSMQWNVEADDPGELTSIEMIEAQPNTIEMIASWTGSTYDTFTTSGNNITSAIDAGGTGRAFTKYPLTDGSVYFAARKGEKITFTCTATLNAGAVPQVVVYDAWYVVEISNKVSLAAGANTIEFTLTQDTTRGVFWIETAGATNFAIADASGTRQGVIDIYDFFYRSSYLKPINTSFTNVSYTIFNSADGIIISIEKTVAAGEDYGHSNTISVTENEKIVFRWSNVLTSGTEPKAVIVNAAGTDISNVVTLTAGLNLLDVLSVTETDASARIRIRNLDTELTDCDVAVVFYKSVMPGLFSDLTDEYFQYKGETLYSLLPTGTFYLKMESENGYVYYSDWFKVDCVYENLISEWENGTYETFTSSGTAISSAINTVGGEGRCLASLFDVQKDEQIRVIFNFTLNSGTAPDIYLVNSTWSLGDSSSLISGINDITLTAAFTGLAYLRFYVDPQATDFSTSEVLVIREYSTKYLTINFSNLCDLGDILYQDGFDQTLWYESETMETSFPQEEEGQKNGEGRFIRTFARQVKKYLSRTKQMPDYMVDVFNRMKLHDDIELIDLVGDVHDVYNLEVEHEWLFDDKYYAKMDLTFDYDEAVVVSACCTNIT